MSKPHDGTKYLAVVKPRSTKKLAIRYELGNNCGFHSLKDKHMPKEGK
jgi:hypothetical protein